MSNERRKLLRQVLDAASDRVRKWPWWRRSYETRRQLAELAEQTFSTKQKVRETKVLAHRRND